jgi:hypothetical protein
MFPECSLNVQVQLKKPLQWLMRLFFACTIAFEVPIQTLWKWEIFYNSALFSLASFGKLATGERP